MRTSLRDRQSSRELGSGLILILVVIIMILGFLGVLTLISTVELRAQEHSELRMQAFYLADSGAQAGIARLRASEGALDSVTFQENIGQGNAAVTISKENPSLFKILSTGTSRNESRTVEVFFKFQGGFSLPGAVSMAIGPGTRVRARTLRIQSYGTSRISGNDHNDDGTLLGDQSKGKYALAANPIPGRKRFAIEYDAYGNSVVDGVPAPYTNSASNQDAILKGLRDIARDTGDLMIVGSKVLDTADTGAYGTPSSPKLIYARLGDDESIKMNNTFTGYGTLVIDVNMITKGSVLEMDGFASWYGLILIYCRNDAEIATGGPLVHLTGDSKIVGSLVMFLNNDDIEISGKGVLLKTSGGASILYSSNLISVARGTETLVTRSARVISYRIP